MSGSFNLASAPLVYFGAGKFALLPEISKRFGSNMLLVTGAGSFMSSSHGSKLFEGLKKFQLNVYGYKITQEPGPDAIDQAVLSFADKGIDVVVAIGGGSVLDGGKAISAMLPLREKVVDYLEGVGTKNHPGLKVPFIAVPTTSGTGSEATKNAVISETGPDGFKKSLRHDNFVPNAVVVDPILTVSCPKGITATSGMDAFTQLLESYVSTQANPVTDALALEGLSLISKSLLRAFQDGHDLDSRSNMALAAYLSGVTLANAGLGLVHGFASAIGGYFEIAHGAICSALMPAANRLTVEKLKAGATNPDALRKYARAGGLFGVGARKSDEYYISHFLDVIDQYYCEMQISPLGALGISKSDLGKIIQASENKNNPVKLHEDEMNEVLMLAF